MQMKTMMIIQMLESHAVMTQQVNQSEMLHLEGECRGQVLTYGLNSGNGEGRSVQSWFSSSLCEDEY
jgi:hypothetical protein